jgi:hypothetical protein
VFRNLKKTVLKGELLHYSKHRGWKGWRNKYQGQHEYMTLTLWIIMTE